MGNTSSEVFYYTCHNCGKYQPLNRNRLDVNHGGDWKIVCNQNCYNQWKTIHDHKGYCCNPQKQTKRPLLVK